MARAGGAVRVHPALQVCNLASLSTSNVKVWDSRQFVLVVIIYHVTNLWDHPQVLVVANAHWLPSLFVRQR